MKTRHDSIKHSLLKQLIKDKNFDNSAWMQQVPLSMLPLRGRNPLAFLVLHIDDYASEYHQGPL